MSALGLLASLVITWSTHVNAKGQQMVSIPVPGFGQWFRRGYCLQAPVDFPVIEHPERTFFFVSRDCHWMSVSEPLNLLNCWVLGTQAPWHSNKCKKKNERLYTVISTPFNVRCHLCQRYAPSFIIFHAVCTYQFVQFGLRKRKPSRSISRFPSLAAVFSSPPKYLV